MFKNNLYPFLIIAGWSFLVHLPGITSPLLDYHAYRQCQTASMAKNYANHGMHFLSPELDTEGPPMRAGTEFPIFSYLLALLFQVFGIHDILGRLLSCLFAAWGAIYLYLFVRPRLGETIALWSAVVMCSIPVHIYFTRAVQPEPMALWALLGFLYYSDQWLKGSGTSATWVLALLLGALSPLLKLPFLYFLAPLWLYLGIERYRVALWKKPAWLILMALVLLFTEAWYHYAKTAYAIILPLSMHEHLVNLAPILTFHLWETQFISRIPELILTYSGLVFAAVSLNLFRKEKSAAFFLAWLLTCIPYVGLLGEYGLVHRYTLLPLAPAAAVWIAWGITALWDRSQDHSGWRALVIVLVIGIPVHSALRIKHWYRLEYPYVEEARQAITNLSQPDDLIVVATHEKPVVLYYVNRHGYAVEPVSWTTQEIDRMPQRGARFVFIPLDENRERLAEWKTYLAKKGTSLQKTTDFWLYRIDGSGPAARQG